MKKTPLMGKKLRNEKKICLIFQSAFLNFSNEQHIFADPDCLNKDSFWLLEKMPYETLAAGSGAERIFPLSDARKVYVVQSSKWTVYLVKDLQDHN